MDNNATEQTPETIIVSLGSAEYTVPTGKSVEIAVFITNPSLSGDYFKVNLLGIPQSWVTYPDQPAVWVPAGGQEKVILRIHPSAVEGVIGSYLSRIQVVSQSAPDKGKELEIQLKIVPEEKNKVAIQLRIESEELKAVPGSEVKIPVAINNLSQEAESLELSVQGVPASWVSLPSAVVSLLGGEGKRVEIILQIPPTPEIRAGYVPLKIIALSQKNPTIKNDVEVKLRIAAFESSGRVGVMLSSVQFSTAPGSALTIPVTVLNRGLEGDTFRLGVEGIPVNWVSTSTPSVQLEPGENKELSLVIQPTQTSSSQAGRYKFFILVVSQKVPDQVVKVDCTLSVAAYTKFSAKLDPEQVKIGETVSVRVKNDGNTQQVFQLSCASQNDQLLFEFKPPIKPVSPGSISQQESVSAATQPNAPASSQTGSSTASVAEQAGDPTTLSIPAGEAAAFRFTTRPRQRPLLGGAITYPYHVSVKSQQQEGPSMPGQVMGRGMIPIWVLPVGLVLCVVIVLAAIFGYRDGMQTSSATQTAVAEATVMAGATQTITANQTAAAIAGQLDSDGDGLTDQKEIELKTNQYNPDTDGDKSWDGVEVQVGSNPLNPDSDADGLLDGDEIPPCPDPLKPDSDQDGIIDSKDLEPCNASNPALTATAASLLPTVTPIPTTAIPTQTPVAVTPSPTSVSLPRFGGVILFTSDRDGNPEIYAVDDAGQIKRMTDNPGFDAQAVWDPAMQRVAFTTSRDGQNEIYLMNADGTNPINLSNNPGDDQGPAWSVDGEWIAFASNRDGNYEIYILRVSDSQLINLTNNPGNDTQPNWVRSTTFDASGESIIFTSDRDGNQEIYRMKTDGTEATNLTGNPASEQMAKGSPDGALVVFTTNRDGNQEIYTMRIDGVDQLNQTNNPSNDFGASWSSSQAWIAFTSERDGNREVYITKPGMLELYNLTNYAYQDEVSDWR